MNVLDLGTEMMGTAKDDAALQNEVVVQVEDQLISVESVRWDYVNSRAVIELGAFVADAEQ
jgi:hypothetical protein